MPVALTVRDLPRSVDWYVRVLALERIEEVHEDGHDLVVLLHAATDIAVNLHCHETNPGDGFDETRTGLDHLSFLVPGGTELTAWAAHLDA